MGDNNQKGGRFISIRTKFFGIISKTVIIPTIAFLMCLVMAGFYLLVRNTVLLISGVDNQTLINIESFVDAVSSLTNYAVLDDGIRECLNEDYSLASWQEDLRRYRNSQQITNSIARLYHLNNFINSIVIIPDNTEELYSVSITLNPEATPREYYFYKDITEAEGKILISAIADNPMETGTPDTLTVGRAIVDPMQGDKRLGVLIINVEEKHVVQLWDDGQITANSSKMLLYENTLFGRQQKGDQENLFSLIQRKLSQKEKQSSIWFLCKIDKTNFLVYVSSPNQLGMQIVNLIPVRELLDKESAILIFLMVLIVLMLFFTFTASFRASKTITVPILKLQKTMLAVQNGDMDIRAEEGNDEIGQLSNAFNQMTENINDLIEQIKQKERERSKAQIQALQAQINPHFIYNTLNSIKLLAEMQGASFMAGIIDDFLFF